MPTLYVILKERVRHMLRSLFRHGSSERATYPRGIRKSLRLRHSVGLAIVMVLICAVAHVSIWSFPLVQAQATTSTASWFVTGSMQTGRAWHSATLLKDGRVLVAAGSPSGWGGSTKSAELYNPATGTWSATGSLNQDRFLHSATLLPDGKVLVAGGENSMGWMSSAEIYDPATGKWTLTASMKYSRSMHSATLLTNGKVLVAGGFGGGDLNSAEIYDPATGVWTLTGSMRQPRMHHPAVLLPDGRVLVCGGAVFGGAQYPPTTGTEIYDPATGQWSQMGNLQPARHNHQAVLLANGKVLAVAGSGSPDQGVITAELYDPATGEWTATGSLLEPHAHVLPLATFLPDGKVLISGGYNQAGKPSAVTEIYDPATASWERGADMNTARYEHSAVALQDGRILSIGGLRGLASAEIYSTVRMKIFLPLIQR